MKLLISRNPEKNTEQMFENIRKNYPEKRAYVVVPGQSTLKTDIHLIDALKTNSVFQVKAKSFRTLMEEVQLELGKRPLEVLTDAGRRMVLSQAIDAIEEDLTIFRKNAKREEFQNLVLEELHELKEYGITPDILEELAEETDRMKKKKLEDLVKIYRSYQTFLGDRYQDAEDRMEEVLQRLPQMESYRKIDFYFDGFYSMSKQELEWIRILDQIASSVTVTLTLDPLLLTASAPVVKDVEVFDLSLRFYRQLQQIGNVEALVAKEREGERLLEAVRPHLFSYDSISLTQEDDSVQVVQCKSTTDEIIYVLSEIRRLIRTQGYRYGDFNLILADSNEYAAILKRQLKTERMPYFLDEKRRIQDHALVKWLLQLTSLVLHDFTGSALFPLLKSPFSHLNVEEVMSLENYCKRNRLKGTMFFNDAYFHFDEEYYSYREEERERAYEEFQKVLRAREAALDLYEDLYHSLKKRQPMKDFIGTLYDFMSSNRFQEAMTAYEELLLEHEKGDLVEEQNQIWDQLMAVFDEMVHLYDEVISFEEFESLLRAGLSGIQIGVVPPYQDSILINSLVRSRAQKRKVSFFIGFSDLYFPKRSKQAEILTQEDKKLLQEKGYFLPSMQDFMSSEENLAFYESLFLASDKMYFSYALINSDNRTMRMSFSLRRLKEMLPEANFKTLLEPEISQILDSRFLLQDALANAVSNFDRKVLPKSDEQMSFFLSVYQWLKDQGIEGEVISRLERERVSRKTRLEIQKQTGADLFGDYRSLSASRLESFNQCRYRYFVERGLRLERPQTQTIDPIEMGNLLHENLRSFTQDLMLHGDLLDEDQKDQFDRLLNESYERAGKINIPSLRRANPQNKFQLKLAREAVEEAVREIGRQLSVSRIRKIYQEERFGPGGRFPGIPLQTQDGKTLVTGFIDRIDVLEWKGEEAARVIDYKSGNRDFKLYRVLSGLDLQLVLYLIAVKDADLEPIGAFYLPVLHNRLLSESQNMTKEEKLIQDFLMSGFFLKDADKVSMMDKSALENNKSQVFAGKGRKRKLLEKDNAITEEAMQKLMQEVLSICKKTFQEMESGIIDPNPYYIQASDNKRATACQYCEYNTLCKFEKSLHYTKYRFVYDKDWSDLEGES